MDKNPTDRILIGSLVSFAGFFFIARSKTPTSEILCLEVLLCVLAGILSQFLYFRLVSENFHQKCKEITSVVLSKVATSIFMLFPLAYSLLFIYSIIKFIGAGIIKLLQIDASYAVLVDYIAVGIVGVFVIQEIIDFLYGTKAIVTKNFYPVDFQPANNNMSYSDEWKEFILKIKPNDEIWKWSSPEWTWKMMVGRCGYMIVRSGRTTRHRITTGMN